MGIPISRALLDAGHRVIGIDSSFEMLRRFKANCPGAGVVRGLVPDCGFVHADAGDNTYYLARKEGKGASSGRRVEDDRQ